MMEFHVCSHRVLAQNIHYEKVSNMTQSTTVLFFSTGDIINPASYLWVCFSALGLSSSYLQQYLDLLLRLDNTKLIYPAS